MSYKEGEVISLTEYEGRDLREIFSWCDASYRLSQICAIERYGRGFEFLGENGERSTTHLGQWSDPGFTPVAIRTGKFD